MARKTYNVCVTMPDLAAAHAEQEARVEAGHWAAAVRLACDEISKRPHVLGKHIKSARIQLSIIENGGAAREKESNAADDAKGNRQEGLLFEL